MKLVSAEEMRELDRRTIEEFGTSGDILMDRAGQGIAEVVRRLAEVSGFVHPSVHLLAGRGNNGGDAFTAARYLKESDLDVMVWVAGATGDVKGDAFKHLSRMKDSGIQVSELPTKEDWDDALTAPAPAEILVDGLLGTGSKGPARGPAVGAIQYINALSNDALVVAIDVPSGLDADAGVADGDAVRADVTVTMGLPKRGLVQPAALDYVGTLEVVDIGIPVEYIEEVRPEDPTELIYASELKPLFTRRARASHKGNYGHVLLIGGAAGYTGAIAMAARTAVRSGTGLVTVLTPRAIVPLVAGAALEAMVHPGIENENGALSADAFADWKERVGAFSAVLVGPGMTRSEATYRTVMELLELYTGPLVVDADALSVLAGKPDQLRKAAGAVVITPHPGELATLMGGTAKAVQSDRFGAVEEAARRTGATVILKGAGTLVAEEGRPVSINMTGNPGMASGGAGDVLAGLLIGLLGQGLQPYDAARVAVFLHGRAGDMVAWRKSQAGLVPGDLITELPYAFRELTLR